MEFVICGKTKHGLSLSNLRKKQLLLRALLDGQEPGLFDGPCNVVWRSILVTSILYLEARKNSSLPLLRICRVNAMLFYLKLVLLCLARIKQTRKKIS
jgi:hypothetical protein